MSVLNALYNATVVMCQAQSEQYKSSSSGGTRRRRRRPFQRLGSQEPFRRNRFFCGRQRARSSSSGGVGRGHRGPAQRPAFDQSQLAVHADGHHLGETAVGGPAGLRREAADRRRNAHPLSPHNAAHQTTMTRPS